MMCPRRGLVYLAAAWHAVTRPAWHAVTRRSRGSAWTPPWRFPCSPDASRRESMPPARRGLAYLAVLAVTAIVATMGLGALLAVRVQARAANLMDEVAEARLGALSAIELGRLWISQDSNWRTNRSNGVWVSGQAIGSGTFTLEVTDPIDGNLANRPHDPVVMKATAVKGQARQILQVTLVARPTPLPALACACHTGGQIHVDSGDRLTAKFATISTNGNLDNAGTITGNVQAAAAEAVGNVNGTLTLGAAAKAFPASTVPEMYASQGTEISPGTTINKQALGPGRNPWGAANADGVYVIRTSNDLTIKRTRIYGTLVVICPGRTVTLQDQVFLHPVRSDYPALIVHGNLALQYTTANTPLSESTQSTNYNPTGVPYEGTTDSDKYDQYPSEIQGLVHVTGTVDLGNDALVRGAILAESTAITGSVKCHDNNEIVYTPTLYTDPPQGYTTAVPMVPQTGSWQQGVD